ncbi:MAG: hypothetical protein V5A39_13880 [Haloarculaceae archaeon]
MPDTYRVSIKQSVFQSTGLSEEEYGDSTLKFQDESAAETWVDETNEELSSYGQLVLHTAHPNDKSGVDAYLIYKDQPVWTTED